MKTGHASKASINANIDRRLHTRLVSLFSISRKAALGSMSEEEDGK